MANTGSSDSHELKSAPESSAQPQSYPQLSDLIFSNTNTSFNKVLGDLKRNTLSIPNRLRSIQQDATFVSNVASTYQLPLIANERCGSWYIPPEQKAQSAYFKSTDGHMSQWSFSLRRLNLQVLDTVAENGGCIIVDSTRRGKSMPDALSKTVPIWCTVLNRVLFPDQPESHIITTPPTVVGASEHAQITARIPGFVNALETLNLDLPALRQKLCKPLRPIWVTPLSTLPISPPAFSEFYPVILLTASSRVSSETTSDNNYIQGAADDHEAWGFGLTAPLFWQHVETLLNTPDDDMESVIKQFVKQGDGVKKAGLTIVSPTTSFAIGTIAAAEQEAEEDDVVITVAEKESNILRSRCGKHYLHLTLAAGKVGSRNLRHTLPTVFSFLKSQLQSLSSSAKIIVADETGKDQGIGVALAILCLFIDNAGNLKTGEEVKEPPNGLNKQIIKQKLSWISVVRPEANASRTTLQSVNAYLLG